MKYAFILFLFYAIISLSTLKENKDDRLTFVQTFEPEKVNYIFNAEDEFVKHGFFEKDEKITN